MSRGSLILLIAVVGAGCAANEESAGMNEASAAVQCGLRAAMDARLPQALRDNPPACALPTEEEVASTCAVQDLVTSPDYRPPTYDEDGRPIIAQPTPEYGVSRLRCRFSSLERNKAECRFTLAVPQREPTDRTVTFDNEFWQDHGEAHHFYGTRWSPASRCAPALVEIQKAK